LILVLGCALAAGGPEVIGPDALRSGMKGYGLSVFKGERIERFEVEVLGVLKNFAPKGDVILARLSGAGVDRAGVIAGMSGSPVYIEGKLAGAVAYAWGFAREPIAGIQPIGQMLPALEMAGRRGAEPKAAGLERAAAVARRVLEGCHGPRAAAGRDLFESVAGMLSGEAPAPPAGSGLRRLPFPLCVSGGPKAAAALRGVFGSMSIVPVAGADGEGGGRAPLKLVKVALKPGMPVGAALVSGDLDWTGLGTLTYVEGDRLIAFGHPMMGWGRVAFPMVVGEIVDVLPSQAISFKFGRMKALVGTVTEDRDTAIAGRIGLEPPTIPVHVSVDGERREDYDVRVAVDPRVTPILLMNVCGYLCGYFEGGERDKTFDGRVRVKLRGREEPLTISNAYATRAESLMRPLVLPVQALMDNPFARLPIERIEVAMKIVPENRTAEIAGAFLDRYYAGPGGKVKVTAVLRPWRAGRSEVRTVTFEVPPDAEVGSEIHVLVCGGSQSELIDLAMAPGLLKPRNTEQLLSLLGRAEPTTNLVARVSAIKRGLSYEGQEMPNLPPSVAGVLAGSIQSGVVEPLVHDEVRRAATPWIVLGHARLKLKVVR
jgi:hypothetical protein